MGVGREMSRTPISSLGIQSRGHTHTGNGDKSRGKEGTDGGRCVRQKDGRPRFIINSISIERVDGTKKPPNLTGLWQGEKEPNTSAESSLSSVFSRGGGISLYDGRLKRDGRNGRIDQ